MDKDNQKTSENKDVLLRNNMIRAQQLLKTTSLKLETTTKSIDYKQKLRPENCLKKLDPTGKTNIKNEHKLRKEKLKLKETLKKIAANRKTVALGKCSSSKADQHKAVHEVISKRKCDVVGGLLKLVITCFQAVHKAALFDPN
uniref:Uncharacterized protein n=1 Tax=Rhodnius prolixus TaxID=13249 RepID=T1H943_RHOPR